MEIITVYDAGKFPQFVSADGGNAVVYWVDYDTSENQHKLMKTYYSGRTVDLNISYPGEIKITQDVLHVYVLDVDNDRIDKYKKSSMEKIESFATLAGAKEIIAGVGECHG